MPTVGERLATLERIAVENRDKIDHAVSLIDGGDGVEWDRSVRGRLHAIEGTLTVIGFYTRLVRGWRSVLLLVCAVGTVAAAWYSALAH